MAETNVTGIVVVTGGLSGIGAATAVAAAAKGWRVVVLRSRRPDRHGIATGRYGIPANG